MPQNEPILQVASLSVEVAGRALLREVSFDLAPGAMLCVVGESGAGKSTLLKALQGGLAARCLRLRFTPADLDISGAIPARSGLHQTRWVMQDPLAALNPRLTLGASIAESLHRRRLPVFARKAAVLAALADVELGPEFQNRLPGQVSLGQAQRACLARALIARPKLIFFDEPLSALDAMVQKKIARQMDELRRKTGIAYVVVTHDLSFAAAYADQILVLRQGKVEAYQPREVFFAAPASDYAAELIAAARSLGTLDLTERAA